MSHEVEPHLLRLIAAHPALFPGGKVPDVFSCVSTGWYDLVHRLCTDIELVDIDGDFAVAQIKEKFGALCFYLRQREREADVQVDEAGPGAVQRIEATRGPSDDVVRRVRELVSEAELASTTICEKCGRPGRLLRGGGWIQTRCAEHAPEGAIAIRRNGH